MSGTPSSKIYSFPLFLGKRSLFPWMAEYLSDGLISCVSYSLYYPVFGAKEVLSVDELVALIFWCHSFVHHTRTDCHLYLTESEGIDFVSCILDPSSVIGIKRRETFESRKRTVQRCPVSEYLEMLVYHIYFFRIQSIRNVNMGELLTPERLALLVSVAALATISIASVLTILLCTR